MNWYITYIRTATVVMTVLWALVGCGKSNVDPELAPYLTKFYAVGGFTSSTPINMQFGNTDETYYDGVCNNYDAGIPEVIISKQYWDKYDETSRTLLVFHELGHCLLGLSHDMAVINGEPESIMWPTSTQLHEAYKADPTTYNAQLFAFKPAERTL